MLKIKYDKILIDKQYLTPLQTGKQPTISYLFEPNELYTLIMYDPDTPMGDYVHWLVINIKDNINNGQTIIPYKGPSPPINTGIHRYIFYIYKQTNFINKNFLKDIERTIKYEILLDKLGLNNKPITETYFTSKYQIGGKKNIKSKKSICNKFKRINKTCKKHKYKKQ